MSHRSALALSIALTLLLAAGVIVGRDLFFTAESANLPSASSAPPTVAVGSNKGEDSFAGAPQVIDRSLPQRPDTPLRAAGNEPRPRHEDDDDDSDGESGDD